LTFKILKNFKQYNLQLNKTFFTVNFKWEEICFLNCLFLVLFYKVNHLFFLLSVKSDNTMLNFFLQSQLFNLWIFFSKYGPDLFKRIRRCRNTLGTHRRLEKGQAKLLKAFGNYNNQIEILPKSTKECQNFGWKFLIRLILFNISWQLLKIPQRLINICEIYVVTHLQVLLLLHLFAGDKNLDSSQEWNQITFCSSFG